MSQLSITDLCVEYRTDSGSLQAVDRASLDLARGEIVGVVGESGSGKSTVAESVIRILDTNGRITGGEIAFDDEDLTGLTEKELAETIRGSRIGMMFQDPHASLSPVSSVGTQITDLVRAHHDVDKKEAKSRAISLLADVGISSPEQRFSAYPHSFSGGMLQRVMLAMSIAGEPELLIADEPTTGLDMTIQAQILSQLESLNESREMGIMLITHDLDVVKDVCDRIVVMYDGNVVERGPCDVVTEDPKHPYTAELIQLTLGDVLATDDSVDPLESAATTGCPFHNACPEAVEGVCDSGDIPPMYEAEGGRPVRCHLYDPELSEGEL
jgi:ABC-type dipeptide/oligopeptide/nickel transport system ATPase component